MQIFGRSMKKYVFKCLILKLHVFSFLFYFLSFQNQCLLHLHYLGPRYVLMNQHMLLHLKKSVYDHGPLWSSSLFVFEDWNGDIGNYFHGTQNIANQVRSCMTCTLYRNPAAILTNAKYIKQLLHVCTCTTS